MLFTVDLSSRDDSRKVVRGKSKRNLVVTDGCNYGVTIRQGHTSLRGNTRASASTNEVTK